MGDEISHSRFQKVDFQGFESRLKEETEELSRWFDDDVFSTHAPVSGLELEAWLIDAQALPAPCNKAFIEALDDPLVVPELARFNVEFNVHPQNLTAGALAALHQDLLQTWQHSQQVAGQLGCRLLMTGILPSVRQADLSLDNMSGLKRYRALNEQVLRMRDGHPLQLNIRGREHLNVLHKDVMLESAATSLQLHLKVAPDDAVRYYNAAQVVSAPMVAASSNSPYLFGKELWNETRIPLFEQSVETGGFAGARRGPLRRVSFGTGYARDSLLECFIENQQHYPVLLPMQYEDALQQLRHLRLHNGTIWRWNRPLIGFDDDGTPHLRIEHRVMPGGPTVVDAIANTAFFYGLVESLASDEIAPETLLEFAIARDNFYAAARDGLDAQLIWLDGQKRPVQALILDRLVPQAGAGLDRLGIDAGERDFYLGIITSRVANACTGSSWQRAWVARHQCDMQALTQACYERQQSEQPVHDWDI